MTQTNFHKTPTLGWGLTLFSQYISLEFCINEAEDVDWREYLKHLRCLKSNCHVEEMGPFWSQH